MTKNEYREYMVQVLFHIQTYARAFDFIAVDDYVAGVSDRIRVFGFSLAPERLMTPKEFVGESMGLRRGAARLTRTLTVIRNDGHAYGLPDMPSGIRDRIAEELDALILEMSEGPIPCPALDNH